jgi:extracellular elastinolytic metalloproteinase
MLDSWLRRPARVLVALAAFTVFTAPAAAAVRPDNEGVARDKKAFFDVRQTPAALNELRGRAAKLRAEPPAAAAALKRSLGVEGVLSLDPLTSTARAVGRTDALLTGPSNAPAASIAIDYVTKNAAAIGLTQPALGSLQLTRDYVSIDGTHHLFYAQSINGIHVFGNGLKANVAADGRLINVLGSPLADLSTATSTPAISPGAAVAAAKRDAGLVTVPLQSDSARQVYFRTVSGTRIAYETIVGAGSELYLTVVDAVTGEVLYRNSLVDHATGVVLDYYPSAPAGGTRRSVSLDRWLSSGATTLTGPNVHVYSDIDDSNDAAATEETGKDSSGNFNYAFNAFNGSACVRTLPCSWNPSQSGSWGTNRNQSATQLFFFINTFHDHLAAGPIGFTPAAGNFEGNDPVLGENIDGASTAGGLPDADHIDNANFGTPPDGQSPRMQMYLWHQPGTKFPSEDPFIAANGSDEADIVYHENTHGLSNRLVVDADGNSTLGAGQAGAMGEAWSDWYAMDFLNNHGFQPDTAAAGEVRVGNYVGAGADLIRTEPLDCPVGGGGSACPGRTSTGAGGYTYGDYGNVIGRPEVHADGEIWGQTLWELRSALGSATAESLITRGMELSPSNPSFLDMRNAILQADLVAGGASRTTIWSIFAKRGMGYFASSVDGDDTKPVEDFSAPPAAGTPQGKLIGSVSDRDTGKAITGATVAFGGHDSGFPGDLAGITGNGGQYTVNGIFFGTYAKVFAAAPGYDTAVVPSLTIDKATTQQNWTIRRDWAALGGGGSVSDFNGPDYTDFGCGPSGAIDQSLGVGWASDTDADATATGKVTPKFVTVKLPVAVNISEIAVDPSNTCGDAGSAATHRYTIETSTDGQTFTLVNEGVFYAANRGHLNTVSPLAAGATSGIRYVRFTMVNPMVPETGTSCDGPQNCGDAGVATRCGPNAPDPGNFSGCTFMDMSEIKVYGRAS